MTQRAEIERLVALKDCPIGLFWSDDELCLKTEYGNNEGRIDAYIVSSGEFFWGSAPQTIASQREQLVRPQSLDALTALIKREGELMEALKGVVQQFESDFCIEGVVVDDPPTTFVIAWKIALAALNPKTEGT